MKNYSPIMVFSYFVLFIVQVFIASSALGQTTLPPGFMYLDDELPTISIDLRYEGENNFLGRPVAGYENARAVLSIPAARALSKVQHELHTMGLGLEVFDAYRPQKAVDDFVSWGKNLDDKKMKKSYYPDVKKQDLFKKGYVAEKSSHSRGSTVDVTLIGYDKDGNIYDLDMGSGFDFFGEISHPDYVDIPAQARANRLLLRTLMIKHGFKPLSEEWWHFTYEDEPFPNTYFDFPMQ
jgi:D-alanyl-D-alanine dipeptidase